MTGMPSGLFVILWLIFVVSAISRSAKKAQTKNNSAQNRPAQPGKPGQPAKTPVSIQVTPSEPARVPVQPAQESMSHSLERRPLTSTIRVTPHDHSNMFAGSLNADDSGEGYDPHDHGFSPVSVPSMTSDRELNASFLETAEEPTGGFRLNMEPDSLVQAFVMQAVLRRPSERRAVR